MSFAELFENGLWAALFATGLGALLTTPARFLLVTFVCAFSGRIVRDVLVGWGVSLNWSTVVAAAALTLIAAAMLQRRRSPPVVLVCAVLPLGAAVAMFNTITGLMLVSSARGAALEAASVALSANAGKAFTGTLAIAVGLVVGTAIERIFKRPSSRLSPVP